MGEKTLFSASVQSVPHSRYGVTTLLFSFATILPMLWSNVKSLGMSGMRYRPAHVQLVLHARGAQLDIARGLGGFDKRLSGLGVERT